MVENLTDSVTDRHKVSKMYLKCLIAKKRQLDKRLS